MEIINIETLFIPNLHRQIEHGSETSMIEMNHRERVYTYQVIRVWYKE